MPIRLYAPDQYREPKLFTHTELLFPFWGVTAKESMPYVRAAALQYQYSKQDFALVDRIEDAEYVLVPYSYERLKATNARLLSRIIDDARNAGKPLLIDGAGDIEHPIEIPNSVILRVSQYKGSVRANEITVPFPAEDLLESYAGGELKLREKPERPSVGFTGWAALSTKAKIKLWVKEFPLTLSSVFHSERGAEHKGVLFRERALRVLSNEPRIESRFVSRPSYSGHTKTVQGSIDDNRKQFVENLLSSDYALCVKGDANASVRFYEALSLGRIPLFLDTACVLPLEDTIKYRDFCVFVDWRDIDRLGDMLVDFHRRLSPDRFIAMQKEARATYRQHLRFDAFSRELANQLKKRATKA